MKYVRVLLLALAAFVFVAPAASAQGGGGGGGGGGGRSGRGGAMTALMANITLDAAQQAKVDSITAHYRELRTQMGGGGGTPPDSATMVKMRENTQKQYDDIRLVLTADQQKVFDENRKNLPTGRRGGGTTR